MKIAIYCPDRHIVYDGSTPDTVGVGGGITVRIRLAAALAALGHDVELVCNCSAACAFHGVRYRPLDGVNRIESDVLVMHTSGGGLDFTPLRNVDLQVRQRALMLSGTAPPIAWADFDPGLLIAPSNFVLHQVRSEWTRLPSALLVSPHGIERRPHESIRRDASGIIYSSHPCKGLDAAVAILQLLRGTDPSFALTVYGGNRLWGGEDQPVTAPGATYKGLRPQSETIDAYAASGFSLHLQTREEPFGLAIIEAMAAGCVVIASPVGAYRELVQNGSNGFLIEGDPADTATQHRAADLMLALRRDASWTAFVRAQATAFPLTWDTIARAWTGYWEHWLEGRAYYALSNCPLCRGNRFALADGYHCARCGTYARSL